MPSIAHVKGPAVGTPPSSNNHLYILSTSQSWVQGEEEDQVPKQPFIIGYQISTSQLNWNPKPQLLHLTIRLGLPLKYRTRPQDWPAISEDPAMIAYVTSTAEEGSSLVDTTGNLILQRFSMRPQPGTRIIFHRDLPGHAKKPTIVLGRVDGRELLTEHVRVMWNFIDEELTRSGEREEMIGEAASHAAFFASMTPERFVVFWDWSDVGKGLECPVKLVYKGCGMDNAGKMFRCGKCEAVKYCGVECQKEDWGVHRKVCVKK